MSKLSPALKRFNCTPSDMWHEAGKWQAGKSASWQVAKALQLQLQQLSRDETRPP